MNFLSRKNRVQRSISTEGGLPFRPVVVAGCIAICSILGGNTGVRAVEPNAYIDQGIEKAGAGDHSGAIKDFSHAIKRNPSLPMAYFSRGLSRAAIGEYQEAIKDYSRAIKLNAMYAPAYLNRGQAHGMLKHYQAELNDSSEAIKIAPAYAEAYMNRGIAKSKLNDLRGAEGDFEKAIEFKSDLMPAYYCIGIVRVKLGETRRGVDDYTKAMRLAPGSPISDFTSAIKADPQDPDWYLGRGLAYFVLRNKPAASDDFNHAARLRPMLQDELKRLLDDPSVSWIQK